MLKPGSSKLKESEAELLQEIHEFELLFFSIFLMYFFNVFIQSIS